MGTARGTRSASGVASNGATPGRYTRVGPCRAHRWGGPLHTGSLFNALQRAVPATRRSEPDVDRYAFKWSET